MITSLTKKFFSLLLTLIIIFSLSIPSLADTTPTLTRLAGVDRYATAAAIVNSGWKQSDYAILAYGENYPDALSAAPLASRYNAPILLTTSDSLPAATKQTLINLQVKHVIIIGGTGVITSSIELELKSMGIDSNRIAGQDRYETAIQVAKQIIDPSTPMIFVVNGEDYADALSIAPIAAATQSPIILVPKDGMPDCVKNYIIALRMVPLKIYVIGDSDTIKDNVYYQFNSPERIDGRDKYEKNIAVIQKFRNYFKSDNICLATGENFADALTGSVYAAKLNTPIMLVKNDPQDVTKNYYQQCVKKLSSINVFGGTAVVSDSLIQDLSNKTIVTPQTICNFKDKNLQSVIRKTIHKNNGDITTEDVQSIKCLYANNCQIKDLGGIENCTNLTAIYLDNNQVSDLSTLKGFSNLTTLHLDSNNLLKCLDDLKYICLKNINLRDLSGGDYNCSQIIYARNYGKDIILIDNLNISINQNGSYTLPTTVKAKVYKGNVGSNVAVKWNVSTVDTSEAGTYYYFGTVDGYDGYVILTVEVASNT
ncbi:cell wall-binding repeat-containing protein [Desulfosporosinus sp. SB140]|uniref:cell wall-binding repeat-containing protein n=1 Tax=Desulfosporosinus paludis TaxID=3115649 RepID=UPI0038911011